MTRRNTGCGCGGRIESLESRRLLAAGSLDTSFSGDGKTTLLSNLSATDVALQADGKALVVGTATNSSTGATLFAVGRFNVDGTPDATFGVGGVVTSQLSNTGESHAEAVAIAPGGKIVVVGTARVDSGFSELELAVACYNPDGTPDNSFDDNGVLSMDLGSLEADTRGFDVAVQPDGMIVIVGERGGRPDEDFFVIRLAPNGERDPFFGDIIRTDPFIVRTGVRFIDIDDRDTAVAVKLDSAGRIVVAGYLDTGISPTGVPEPDFLRRVGVVRLSASGDRDETFDDNGRIAFQLPGRSITQVADLLVQSDGKVVIAGHSPDVTGQNDFFVARFTEAGALDTTFGELNRGFTVTDVGSNDVVAGIAATPAGAGGGFIVSGNSGGMAAVKYTDNGLLDTSFGGGGKVRLSFGGTANIASGPGRRFMLAGGNGFATARLLLAGAREVSGAPLDISSAEGTTNTASLFVGRTENLPFPTRVFFSIGGTASVSNTRTGARDWTMPGLVITSVLTPTIATGYVDIPANQTFVLLTFTPINDSHAELTETASFTVVSSSTYEIGSPNTGTIRITDDDTVNLSIGTTTVALPDKQVGVGQELQAAVTWTVPSGGWRQLSTIQLRLRDFKDGDALAVLTFDEATNSFSVESAPGADNPVSLVLSKCSFVAAGPTAPTVTAVFTFAFTTAAANTRFAVDVAATNDGEAFSGFAQIGELHVHKKPNIGHLPLRDLQSPDFTALSKVGDSVTYPLVVSNTGALPVFIQGANDTLLGDIVSGHTLSLPGGPGVNPHVTSIVSPFDFTQPLAPGQSATIFVTRVVQPLDPDPTSSTVTYVATGDLAGLQNPVSTSASNSVNLFQPSATLDVTPSSSSAEHLGDPITYIYTVTNTSSADSPNLELSNIKPNNSFTDTLLGNLEATAIAAGGGSVAPGDSFSFTVTRAIQAGDPNPLDNTGSVLFTLAQNLGSFDNTVFAQDQSSVALLPHLTIAKSVFPGFDTIVAGDQAFYTITVTNDGAGAATNVIVTDQLPAADELSWGVDASTFDATSISGGDFLTASSLNLAAGATTSLTVSAFIPLDIFTNGGVSSPLVRHNTATLTATGIGPITTDDVIITILDAQAREDFI